MKKIIWCLWISWFYVSCGGEDAPKTKAEGNIAAEYAVNYRLDSIPGYLVLRVENFFDNKASAFSWLLQDKRDTTCVNCPIPPEYAHFPIIKYPVERMVALSSTHLGLLSELNLLSKVVAVSQAHLVHSTSIRQAISHDSVVEVGYGPNLQLERVLQMQPDLVLTFAVGDTRYDDHQDLLAHGVPTLIIAEWQEVHPLGRLEWIRLLGLLTDTEARADSIFKQRAQRYMELCTLATQVSHRPVVVTGSSEGENWRLTGGNTFFAHLFKDAQAQYLFAQSTSRSSFKINFEEFFVKARQVDYWINPSPWSTRSETVKNEGRIELFDFWKKNQILIPNKRRESTGGDDFWELGMVRPDLLLSDLLYFLHPELAAADSAVFYQFMED